MPTASTNPALPVFLDCDPGIDDAIALGYLLCQPDVNVAGIAASAGNVSNHAVLRNILGWLELAGRSDIPVHRGADLPIAWAAANHRASTPDYADDTHGPTGAGYAQLPPASFAPSSLSAADAWVRAARAHPGELIAVLIGPATNLALALEHEPALPRLIKRLFIMGGAFNYRGNTWPTTEWNVTFDPEATARVIAAFGSADQLPVIAPIEATESVVMTPQRLSALLTGARRDASPSWQAWLAQLGEALRFYFEFHESDGHGYLAHIHDPYVVAAAIEWARQNLQQNQNQQQHRAAAPTAPTAPNVPDAAGDIPWAETKTAPVDVELTGTLTRGETVADWLGRWNRPVNAEIIRRIDAERFLDHLTSVLQKGPSRS